MFSPLELLRCTWKPRLGTPKATSKLGFAYPLAQVLDRKMQMLRLYTHLTEFPIMLRPTKYEYVIIFLEFFRFWELYTAIFNM